MNAPMKTQSPPALPDWLTVVPQQSEPGFLAFLESLAPEGEKVLFGKAVTMQDGTDGYVPTDTLPPNTALYANTGSFIKARAEQNGSLRAKAENIESCLFLMLDDIGTKAKMPTVEPTWKIETSPGNYQWGYAYAERPTKAEQSAAVKAFAAAGYSDPGANNPVRWARIPGSLNKKKQFVAKLTEFHPERRFLLPELCAAMGVDPEPAQPESHAEGQQPAPPVEQVVEMLRHIDASERKVYLDVGMAMKVAYGDAGSAPWVTWAKTCPEYDNPDAERDAAKDWKSFKDMPDGIGIGTLFHYALSGGWKHPAPDVNGMFGAVEGAQQSQSQPEKKMKVNVSTLFADMTLTRKEVEKMNDAKFIVPDLIVSGHVAAYISPGNGGKTTIFIHLCEGMVEEGYTVTYLNLDGNPDDLKRHFAHAEQHGYTVVSPDACEGGGMDQIMARFKALADSPDTDLNGYVFIIDTLKKVTDVINKSQAKEVYKIFRAMSVKGATVCLLAHANKYRDDAGGLIYEGTADLRNDVDELIYLNPFKDEERGRLEVTTVPDKVRAKIGKRSFLIDNETRTVTELGYVIGTTNKETRQILETAHKAIGNASGKLNQKQLVDIIVSELAHGVKKVREALAHLSRDGGELIRTKIEGKNEYEYCVNEMFQVPTFGNTATENEAEGNTVTENDVGSK